MDFKVPLTQGKFAIVDEQDYFLLNKQRWCFSSSGYACGTTKLEGKYKTVRMHRFILGITDKSIFIDHINLNKLDNRRKNLRICTKSENQYNRLPYKNNSTGYKGVCWDPLYKRFRSYININKKRIWIGAFKNKIEAAISYDEAARKYHQQFSRTNF